MIALVAVLAASGSYAQSTRSAEVQLRAAIHKEEVEGDLKGAIEQYKAIAAKYSKDRPVAAMALVRMAECYQKTGDAEARRIFARVVQEFGDQMEAVARARAHLGGPGAGKGPLSKQLWSGPKADPYGGVSPDGRYISFVDWDTGDLGIHNIAAGTDRLLTNKGDWKKSSEFAEESVISKDGRQIAYAWYNGKDRYEIRVAGIPGSGLVEPRRIFDDPHVSWIAPYDWSPDGKSLAVLVQWKEGRRADIGILPVEGGALRRLTGGDALAGSASPIGMFFSPDGRHLAFDMASDRSRGQHDVFIGTLDGKIKPAVASPAHDWMMGWSPDGAHLLYASDRAGSVGLWSIHVADGEVQSGPELLKPDIGNAKSIGVTKAGALYYAPVRSSADLAIASVNFATGEMTEPPTKPVQGYVGNNVQPAWSPDGRMLAWVSSRGPMDRDRAIGIRDLEKGREREIHPQLALFNVPTWTPDGRSLFVQGQAIGTGQGIYQIDAESGATKVVVLGGGKGGLLGPSCSPDGRMLYYSQRVGEGLVIRERELASGTEREIARVPSAVGRAFISPDGKKMVVIENAPDGRRSLTLIEAADGRQRRLFESKPPWYAFPTGWTADSSGVLALKSGGGTPELWLVPISGGEPRKIDLRAHLGANTGMSVHPDGHRLAFVVSAAPHNEVWVIENFLPATVKR